MNLIELAKQHQFHVVAMSKALKVWGMTVVYTDNTTCPIDCYFKKTKACYGLGCHVKMAWDNTNTDGVGLKSFLNKIPTTHIIRHNEAGDLAIPGTNNINPALVDLLIDAYNGHLVYTYTHCDVTPENIEIVKHAAKHNFIINFSCETLEKCQAALKAGCPAVLAVATMQNNETVIKGIKFVSCPFNNDHKVLCMNCCKCMNFNRDSIIVFEIHGNQKNKVKKLGDLLNI